MAFKAAVQEGNVASIMCAYNGLNGYPMCASPMIQEILRNEYKFDGFVVSDSDAINFIFSEFHFVEDSMSAAAISMNAGVDLNSGATFAELTNALAAQMVTEARLRQAAVRLFTARMAFGEFDPPSSVPWNNLTETHNISTPAHQAVNRRMAEESIVLLTNKNRTLPLPTSGLKRVAVIGPNAHDPMVC